MSTFSISSSVRGYHVYKDIWEAAEGEVLPCTRELNNLQDPFAVAVKKDSTIVGHIPRLISAACSSFLRRNGMISCRVIGGRRYSRDLPQGGLEIPCMLTFLAKEEQLIEKIKKLIKQFESEVSKSDIEAKIENSKPEKKVKVEDLTQDEDDDGGSSDEDGSSSDKDRWISFQRINLTNSDKQAIMSGLELDDQHIDFAQELLRKQFPSLQGLRSTLTPVANITGWVDNYLQIFHCYGNHWVCASTLGCEYGVVHVYDSLYTSVSESTLQSIQKIFLPTRINCIVPSTQKQVGIKDCGLYAIANCTYLAFGRDSAALTLYYFEQKALRSHLIFCLELMDLREFPAAS